MLELLSTAGFALFAISCWTLVAALAAAIQTTILKKYRQIVEAKTEQEWAWLGVWVGGGLLVGAVVLEAGLSVIGTANECYMANQEGNLLSELPDESCSAIAEQETDP